MGSGIWQRWAGGLLVVISDNEKAFIAIVHNDSLSMDCVYVSVYMHASLSVTLLPLC